MARRLAVALSDGQAIAVYVAGILIETVGVALIPAYGLALAGSATAVCGLVIAAIGDRYWSAPAHSSTIAAQLVELISSSNRARHRARPNIGGSQ